jgi:hypothetical protein
MKKRTFLFFGLEHALPHLKDDKLRIIEGGTMKKAELTLPEIALIAGTRGMLGAGAGLLLAGRLNDGQRKAIGWTLLIVGAISTIPLAIEVLSKRR